MSHSQWSVLKELVINDLLQGCLKYEQIILFFVYDLYYTFKIFIILLYELLLLMHIIKYK